MRGVRVVIGDRGSDVYAEAAARIRAGKLVAFPTETVYGLGGDGLNPGAVSSIFAMKRRPLDDPVILHVCSVEEAWPLWQISEDSVQIINTLQDQFWPGPLTIIAEASAIVPPEVTAATGRVAVRCPSHPVARELIRVSRTPIAAPSANLFSRISPTRAEHVKKYFDGEDLLVLECDDCCRIGIESTVVVVDSGMVRVLRAGDITAQDLRRPLANRKISAIVEDKLLFEGMESDAAAKSAPGQCLVHYAPRITTILCIGGPSEVRDLSESAVVDISGVFEQQVAKRAVFYRNIANQGEPGHMARSLFSTLHEVEDLSGASELLICVTEADAGKPEFAGVMDRSIRAAGHRVLRPSEMAGF